jgi:hypothetical protein
VTSQDDGERSMADRARTDTDGGDWVAARLVVLRVPGPVTPRRAPTASEYEVDVRRPAEADDSWD